MGSENASTNKTQHGWFDKYNWLRTHTHWMYSTNNLLSIGKVRQIKMAKISTEVANHSIAGHIQFCAYNIQEYAYVYGRLCCRPSAACVARREWRCACARDFRRRQQIRPCPTAAYRQCLSELLTAGVSTRRWHMGWVTRRGRTPQVNGESQL